MGGFGWADVPPFPLSRPALSRVRATASSIEWMPSLAMRFRGCGRCSRRGAAVLRQHHGARRPLVGKLVPRPPTFARFLGADGQWVERAGTLAWHGFMPSSAYG
jgi:hypothetical protein